MQGKGADGKPAHTDIENRSKSTPGHFRASPLTNLCSELVEVFPEALKVARVTPMYKGGVLTIGRTNKFMPPPWYKGGVGGGGPGWGMESLPAVFNMLQYFETILPFRYLGRHLKFYQELEIRLKPGEMVFFCALNEN